MPTNLSVVHAATPIKGAGSRCCAYTVNRKIYKRLAHKYVGLAAYARLRL